MRQLLFTLNVLLLFACTNTHSTNNDDEIDELVVDTDYYDSLKTLHSDFITKIEIEGKLLPVNNMEHYRVFQSISTESLSNDTLRIVKDGSWWAYPDSTNSIDSRFWFLFEIAFDDIDTSNISSSLVDDVLWINIPSADTLGAVWGKFDTKLNQWHWKVPSNEVRLGYLVSTDKINKSFKSYKMYEPKQGNSIDYASSSLDSVQVRLLYSKIKQAVIGYVKKEKD